MPSMHFSPLLSRPLKPKPKKLSGARFVCMCAGYGAPAETPADKQVPKRRPGLSEDLTVVT